MTNINILYFGPFGSGSGIGGSARVRNMLDVLRSLKTNTNLISYLPERTFTVVHEKVNRYLNITSIYVSSSSPKLMKIPALLLIYLYGLRHIRKSNMVFSHSPSIVYGIPALVLSKLFGKPLLIDLTDRSDIDTPEFIYCGVLRNASIVYAVSHHLVEIAKTAGCLKVIHAPGFIDTDVFRFNDLARSKMRKELSIGNDDVVIGYTGAFSSEEGLSVLLNAFKKLIKRHSNIYLILLGGRNVSGVDNIPKQIKELGVSDRVIIIPPQPYKLIPEYLSAFDIACSPKIDCEVNRVADPIRVYEYMSVELPVVASAIGETAGVIESGRDGFLIEPGDVDDLARTLDFVIHNLHCIEEIKRKAREKVIKDYSQQKIIEGLQIIIESEVKKCKCLQ